jgi:hypothetical protein
MQGLLAFAELRDCRSPEHKNPRIRPEMPARCAPSARSTITKGRRTLQSRWIPAGVLPEFSGCCVAREGFCEEIAAQKQDGFLLSSAVPPD